MVTQPPARRSLWEPSPCRLPLQLAILLAACNVTPLTNKIDVGNDPFVIGVGEGADSLTDLWAAPAGAGSFARLTFNRAEERAPRLAPEGRRVAYLRRTRGDPRWFLVFLDLASNAERALALPGDAGEPERPGWSADGARVVLRIGGAYYATATPPAPGNLVRLGPEEHAAADSLTRERLGPAHEGLVESCEATLCVRVAGLVTSLGPAVRGAVRWGPDSVGYFRGDGFAVRPLGGGRARLLDWKAAPAGLRELTHHPGVRSPP